MLGTRNGFTRIRTENGLPCKFKFHLLIKTEDMKMKILLLLLTTSFCMAADQTPKRCHYRLPILSGIVFYPFQPGQLEEHPDAPEWWWVDLARDKCMLYMSLEKAKTVKLVFRHVDMGKDKILIQSAKKQNVRSWDTLRTITGSKKEVRIEATNIEGFRIVVKKGAGQFMLFYQEQFCKEPDPKEVIRKRCTRGYEMFSVCQFMCREPNYYPIWDPLDVEFSTTCMLNQTWSKNIRSSCSTYKEVIHNCLVRRSKLCKYTVEDIVEMVPEDEKIPLRHEDFESLRFQARVKFLEKKVPENVRPKPVFDICHVHCLQTRRTQAFKYECNSENLPLRQKERCLICRYSGDECTDHILYA